MPKLTEEELRTITLNELHTANSFCNSELSSQREDAMKAYLAEPYGDEREGRSKVVLTDVADTIEWILPSLLRIFASNDEVVRFDPVDPDDDDEADQSTDYVNWVFTKDNPGFLILYTWFKDALLQKNGIVKHWWQETERVEQETYDNLLDEALIELVSPDDVTVEEHSEGIAQIEDPLTGQSIQVPVHAVKIKRKTKDGRVAIENVPPEEFLISKRAKNIKDAPFVAHKVKKTRSELLEQGFDREKVMRAPQHADVSDRDNEHTARFDQDGTDPDEHTRSDAPMQEVDIFECYIRVDKDGDNIAELRKVVMTGADILEEEEADSIPFSSLTPVIMPHKFFGLSMADLVMDLQRIGTTIMRQTLDNMYLTNNARTEIPEPAIGEHTLEDWYNNVPGGAVRTATPGMMKAIDVEPMWQFGAQMLEKVTALRESRTGVTRFSQGLSPDALNKQKTAVEVNAMTEGAQSRVELIARIFAETGVRDLFLAIHALVRKYQDRARTIKLRNKFVEVDPSGWRERTDVTTNVGLGTGNKDQQVVHLSAVLDRQLAFREVGLAELAPTNNVAEVFRRMVEAAGIKASDRIVPDQETVELTQEELQRLIQQEAQALAQQSTESLAQAQIAVDTNKIANQTEADMTKEEQKFEHDVAIEEVKAENKAQIEGLKIASG